MSVLKAILTTPLLPLSWLYRAGLAGYLVPYKLGVRKQSRLPARVVSIGNLTFGGTGKTPIVRLLCDELIKRGLRPAILSRGYGGDLSGTGAIVSDGNGRQLGASDCGDEPALLADALPGTPVAIGKDRRRMGQQLCQQFHPDLILLDDGMQYWQLYRDADIVVVRADSPFGTRRVLPAGDLREPIGGIARAKAVVITGSEIVSQGDLCDLRTRISRYAPSAEVFSAERRPSSIIKAGSGECLPLELLRGLPIIMVSGIAAPGSFEHMLDATGANILHRLRFRDHCAYTHGEAQLISSLVQKTGAKAIVTTAKDAVKLRVSETMLVLDFKLIIDALPRLIDIVVGKTPGDVG